MTIIKEMKKCFSSLGSEIEHDNEVYHPVVMGVILFTSILTTSNTHARDRIASTEVIVYDGEPIDYSNRSDVIFFDYTSPQSKPWKTVVAQDLSNDKPSQAKVTLARRKKPTSQAHSLKNAGAAKQQKIRLNQRKMQLAHREVQLAQQRIQATQNKVATLPKINNINSIAQKKARLQNKKIITNVKGKDTELVAFYLNVFGKQKNNFSKLTSPSGKLSIKHTYSKNIVQIKSKLKPSKVQFSITKLKDKDPELVAFYKRVFGNNISKPYKYTPAVGVVLASKIKDPELVAFYERVFGKSKSRIQMANNERTKMNMTKSIKSNQKRSVKNVKRKVRGTMTMSTASVELEKLIDDLTSKKII
jgi:hypothetical protein